MSLTVDELGEEVGGEAEDVEDLVDGGLELALELVRVVAGVLQEGQVVHHVAELRPVRVCRQLDGRRVGQVLHLGLVLEAHEEDQVAVHHRLVAVLLGDGNGLCQGVLHLGGQCVVVERDRRLGVVHLQDARDELAGPQHHRLDPLLHRLLRDRVHLGEVRLDPEHARRERRQAAVLRVHVLLRVDAPTQH